ncbi:mucin-17 isoform X2 [Aedes aegypti]|uniref:VWFC domain-containing protein n=1 Tax=Aedes aegypti TaxID=7159 RepID=A0A6I8U5K7_AEDAE|nr:mucin-17 isoform X2 [Aedes aegypti]
MCINIILFKMDSIKRQLGVLPGGRSSLLLLYGVLVIMALTPGGSVQGYSVQKRETNSCYYNGTHFMEGSIVPTKEPCLMCKCQSKTLICALKVCPEQPIPPPRGCILVHKSGACCPYLQCSKLHLTSKNSGDRKKIHFLDYYEKEAEERLTNPNSYLRRSDDDDIEENGACIVNGTVYKSGSAMTSSSLCSYCYCINGRQKCVKPKCALPNPRCAPIFIDSACCPIRYDCTGKIPVKDVISTESPNQIRRINNRHYLRTVERKGVRNVGCTIDGKSYPEGERIASQDPCQVCFCIRGDQKCTPKKCAPAIKGCTPRVPRGECCAVRYDCKIGDQKRLSSRKIEEEEEPFDFFSILFGPDPDEPKPEAKNATELIVTEATPVSSTSEKSFFDFLKAGLEFIDSNADDLLETTPASAAPEMSSTTESISEVNTVRVEIVREPQTVYIAKPDFNFPMRMTSPPIRRTSAVLKTTPSTTPTVTTASTTSTTTTTTEPPTTTRTVSSTSTTTVPTTTTTISSTTTTTVPSTTATTTTTKKPPTTTAPSTTTSTTTTAPSSSSTTTQAPSTTSTTSTVTTTVPLITETTILPIEQKDNLTIPVDIDLTKAEPEFQDLESDSLLKENPTDVSNSLADLESSEEYSDADSAETSTAKSMETETVYSTTDSAERSSSEESVVTESTTTNAPIDVVIKIDDSITSSAVESIIHSLNAKIEKVEPLPPTTTIATKRPNNKFVGFEVEKIRTTIAATTVAPTTVPSSTEEVSTESSEVTTAISSQETTTADAAESGVDSSEESTVDYKGNDMLVEDMLTTESSFEGTTTEQSEDDNVETTMGSFEVTSTVATTTIVDDDKMEFKSESETEIPVTEHDVQTTTGVPVTTTTQKIKTTSQKNTTKPLVTKENNLLSVLLTELSNIFDSTRNESGKQNAKNKTEFRPVTPKPIPIGEFHRPSSIPSILESDIDLDYSEPTLPPSLPNLKIIPFLPADAVKKNEAPIPLAAPYDFYKPNPTNYPIITESYEPYGVLSDHEIHPGMPFKPPKYDYSYDQSLSYPALTENYDLDGKSNHYNTKIIRDKYDTIADTDYEYDTDALAKYELHAKKELFKNELKKFIPTKYEVPQEGTYVPVYDKYGVGYPEKNVYYPNHKETYEPVVYNTKTELSTEHPLFRLEEKSIAGSSGFSPPTKTEGGFLPKDHIKDDFYYEPYVTTAFPMEKTTEDYVAKIPINTTASTFGATVANPFIDVIHPEPAPPLMSLIEDKEKLFSVYHSVAKNNHSSLDDLLDTDIVDSAEYDKQIISITTDANYLSTMGGSVEEVDMVSSIEGASALPLHGSMEYTAVPLEMETTQMVRNSTEPEPNGMFSLENVLNYLFREEEPYHDNGVRNTTSTTPSLIDGVPPFKTIPSHLGSVYSPPTSIEGSLGEVQHHEEDDEQHDGTVTLKIENEQNGTKDLYRPSLMDLPFLSSNFHSPSGTGAQDGVELKNDIDRYGFDPDVEHYQVISDGPPNTIPNSETYVVNPVDINKLKQHHSEGTAEITMKSKVYSLKDTVGILKLAGCNIYGRMYRVGRIISELSGPCLECKCTDVGVHCTPLNC